MKKLFIIFVLTFFSFNAQAKQPQFKISNLQGKIFDLSEKKGKVVIINFWAKWCPTCREELPILNEIYKKYKARGLEIIGVSIDDKKHLKEVLEISKEFSFQNSLISEEQINSFGEPETIPLIYIINREGNIVAVLDESDFAKEDLEKVLKPLF